MTIQEILDSHLSAVAYEGPATCSCEEWESRQTGLNSTAQHRAHVAEVLDKHMQEREADVLLKARDRMAKHWPLALDEFEANEVCDWLEHEAYKIKDETPNGR